MNRNFAKKTVLRTMLGAIFAVCAVASAHADDLRQLYHEAILADANFLVTQADVSAQREALPQARSQLLPNLSFSGSKSRNDTEHEGQGLLGPTKNQYEYDSHNYVLSVRQALFRPAAVASYLQSRAQVESADAILEWAVQDIAVRVGSAYFDVLSAQSDLDVNKAQQDAYAAQLTYTERAFTAGAGTRTDIDEARSRLDLAKAQALELQYRLEYVQDALRTLVNRPLTPLAALDPQRLELARPDPERLEDWILEAETVNPKLKSLRANVEVAEKEIWKMKSGHLPTVDLFAQRSKSESENNNTIGSKYDTKMVGIQVNIPIFSGGYVNSTVRQSYAALEKQRQQLEATRRDINLDVRKQFDAATQGVHWVKAYEQAVKSAEQTLFSTKKGFQAGKRNNLDILNAEQNLASARRDLNRGRFQYVMARLQLLALVGRLDDTEMTRFNNWLAKSER
ncbi:MAG: TolC family outer membrane protein [Zoogloeaceae bacterium]|jgi:outer membrane protein/protease secretion system outer membrane protein|nr:TolC family outer membrane protein [Zoogloeaceae bacterium]